MNCSDLANHLFQMNIIDSPHCSCGGIESTEHFFISCPLFLRIRNKLENDLKNLTNAFNLDIILHGNPFKDVITNKLISSAVNEYICNSQRFPLLS